MEKAYFDRLLALNRELAALAELGLPLELDCGQSRESVGESLEKVNSRVALKIGRGEKIDDVLADEQTLPAGYRHALQVGLRSERWTATLDALSRQATLGAEIRSTFGQALVHPLVVFVLAYLGFIYLCEWVGPAIAGFYEQAGQQPSRSVALLTTGKEWLMVWMPLVPLVLVLVILCWCRTSQKGIHKKWLNRWNWLPGVRGSLTTEKHALFAEQLALLIDAGVPLDEALPLASGLTGDAALIVASSELSASLKSGEVVSTQDFKLQSLPPLLRWVVTGDLGGEPLPEVLRSVAGTYRQRAARQAAIWRFAIPTLLGALLGGVVGLAYALSLFIPIIQLLIDTSSPFFL